MTNTINDKPAPALTPAPCYEASSERKSDRIARLVVEFGRLFRFGITGVVATLVYATVSIILVEAFAMGPVAAGVLGYLAASGISYIGHLRFSFAVQSDHRTYFKRFVVISSISFVLNILVIWTATKVLGYPHRLSLIFVSILIPAVNYLCSRFWVFLPGLGSIESSGDCSTGAKAIDQP